MKKKTKLPDNLFNLPVLFYRQFFGLVWSEDMLSIHCEFVARYWMGPGREEFLEVKASSRKHQNEADEALEEAHKELCRVWPDLEDAVFPYNVTYSVKSIKSIL